MTGLPRPAGTPRRIVYLGTPEAAATPLDDLVGAGFDVVLAVTRPDRRRGRGATLSPSPVKAAAERLGIPVSHRTADAAEAGADIGVVVAYGQIVKPDVLAAVPMVNLHFSLLPRWRGAAPVERAILAGDAVTGVCLMQVDEGLDTGDVYARVETPIGGEETADALRARLVRLGSDLLVTSLRAGLGAASPQVGEVTYADKIAPDDRVLRFDNPAVIEHRRVRIGGASTTFRGKRLKVHEARVAESDALVQPGEVDGGRVACADGALRLVTVQLEGQRAMGWREFVNGHRPGRGERLGS